MPSKITLGDEPIFPSNYVSAFDLGGRDATVTIASVTSETLRTRGGQERKPVLRFTDASKKLVLNRTNAETIARLYGSRAEAWKGQRITLFPTRVRFGNETVDAIRVRPVKPSLAQRPAAPSPVRAVVTVPEPAPTFMDDPDPDWGSEHEAFEEGDEAQREEQALR
jgi:hypothetical protein